MSNGANRWARLQSVDQRLTAALTLAPARSAARAAALVLAHSGDSFVWAALVAAGWFLGTSAWKTRALAIFAGLVVLEVVVIAVKMIIRRQRPPGTSGMIYRKTDPFSFPSGHAARAAMLCILAGSLGPAVMFAAILAWSPFMVVSRIAIGIHYVFDVLGGAMLGALITLVLLRFVPLLAALV
jgi:undecaprenyl-diphosphatase